MVSRYRILAISDIHMSNALSYAKPTTDGKTDRLEDQIHLWDQVCGYADENDVDAIVIAGDLFDKKLIDAVTLTETVRALSTPTKAKKYVIPGNHDASNLKGGRFTVEMFGLMGTDIDFLGNNEALVVEDWLRLWPLPYASIEANRASLGEMRKLLKGGSMQEVLIMHNSIQECRHLGWVCDDGLLAEEVCEGFNHVLSGHFHTHQHFGPGDKGFYLGAPMQHNFGDVGETRGFWDVTFLSDGTREAKLVPTELPRFHVTTLDDMADVMLDASAGDYVRVNVDATHADWMRLKSTATEMMDKLAACGLRGSLKHRPIYHHEARLAPGGVGPSLKIGWEETLKRYVLSADVVVGSLDIDRLRRLANDAMNSVLRGERK